MSEQGQMISELGDASWRARRVVEEDERLRTEAAAFQARMKPPFYAEEHTCSYPGGDLCIACLLNSDDMERDSLHDSGEDEWRDE